jgi:hypothetical protein
LIENKEKKNMNEQSNDHSPSAYASAETSPTLSLISSGSSHSLQHTEGVRPTKALPNSVSLNLIQLNDPSAQTDENKPPSTSTTTSTTSSMISSFSLCGISQKLDDETISLMDDFQSLPPAKSDEATVKDIIDKTVKANMDETSPNSKKTQQRSSVLSLFGRMFTKSSDAKKKDDVTMTSMATTSSPNPESSPYKLLNEEKKEEASLEKLASLNHQEHEKIDPVVRGTPTKSATIEQEPSAVILPPIKEAKVENESQNTTTSMTVPASSHEFCMDLHLNIAASASLQSTISPVMSTTTTSVMSPSHMDDHNRFTKNASTSSIHNDLKMILEDSKEPSKPIEPIQPTEPVKSEVKKSEIKREPKPQRTHRSSKSKSSKNAVSTNQSELARIMIQMKNESATPAAPRQHRYSKEFLNKVKDERADFISKICPDIFKAYCYCMTGKYWDPEKYFDIVQYSGDYEKIASQRMNPRGNVTGGFQANRNQRVGAVNNPSIYKKVNNIPTNKPMSNVKSVPKPVSEMTTECTSRDTDKMLLNLLKNNASTSNNSQEMSSSGVSGVNLMEILNKKHTNIITDLFGGDKSKQMSPKHHPMILTAQELEFSQLYSAKYRCSPDRANMRMNNSLDSSPSTTNSSRNNSSTCSSTNVNTDLDNSSDAYKQLVKNLSNHPLSTPASTSTAAAVYSKIDDIMSKLTTSEKKQPQTSDNGTILIKQLLNMDDSKAKGKSSLRQHHHHKSKGRKSKSAAAAVNGETTTTTPVMDSSIENLMLKLKQTAAPMPPATAASQAKTNEQEHFSSLINKLMPTLANHLTPRKEEPTRPNDILKWFPAANNMATQNCH